jgi:hypothetical protein
VTGPHRVTSSRSSHCLRLALSHRSHGRIEPEGIQAVVSAAGVELGSSSRRIESDFRQCGRGRGIDSLLFGLRRAASQGVQYRDHRHNAEIGNKASIVLLAPASQQLQIANPFPIDPAQPPPTRAEVVRDFETRSSWKKAAPNLSPQDTEQL